MYKIYSTSGYDVTTLNEYEGTYETVGKALDALEEQHFYMDNFGYIYDDKMKETYYLITFSYGIDMIHTLGYEKRDTLIDGLKEVMEEIEKRNKKED